jgi:hypothetical protein
MGPPRGAVTPIVRAPRDLMSLGSKSLRDLKLKSSDARCPSYSRWRIQSYSNGGPRSYMPTGMPAGASN